MKVLLRLVNICCVIQQLQKYFFATGARVYEISNIRKDSVNLNTGLIRLMGKGGKERYVQISSTSILALLKKYYAENESAIRQSGYFFVNNRENRYTEQSIRLMLKKYTEQAGIERNITPPYVQTFVCHIFNRRRSRCKLCPANSWSQLHKNDTDLYTYCG